MATGTRAQLLLAARDAIREQGMGGATAREITGRAAANLAAIPYHFGSKDVLITEALVAEAHDLVAPILALLADDRPGPERAGQLVATLGTLFEDSREQVPVYLAALAASPHSPDVRRALAELWRELTDRLADDIAAQRDDGLLPAWVDPSAMSAVIVAVVNGVVVGASLDPDGFDHSAVAAQFLALLLSAGTSPGAAST